MNKKEMFEKLLGNLKIDLKQAKKSVTIIEK